MKPLRICFLNRGRVHEGGDLVALDATMNALRKRGVECVETGWDRDSMRSGNFDLAHIFHCNFSWSWGNYEAVRDVGLPYVLTPIYYPGPLLSGITKDQLRGIVSKASYVAPFGEFESNELRDEVFRKYAESTPAFATKDLPTRGSCIPNGTDKSFHHNSGDFRSGVCCISARGDTDKGIPMLRRICERNGINLEVITGRTREELAKHLTYWKVFVNASESERMSLTIGEALCAGCRVLATDENRGNEWYPGLITFDPRDETKLEHLIRWALASPEWDYRPNAAARVLTWDWGAEKLEGVYREVLAA